MFEVVSARGDAVGRDETAAALGISRELAAFHLDRLVEGGLLSTEYRRRSGRSGPGAGRPAKLYRRAKRDVAVSIPARRYERAASIFAAGLEGMAARGGIEAVADVAREQGTGAGLQARRTRGSRPSKRLRMTALLDLLRDAGYEPDLDRATGALSLRNCPYSALVVDHRDLTCGMNLAWSEGLVAAIEPGLRPELDPQPGHCCVVFRQPGPVGP